MSEMGERAAKAICETLFGPYDGGEADRSDASISGQSRKAARAAFEAMREEDLRIELAHRKFEKSYRLKDDGCWQWTGAIDRRDGYGRFYDGSGKTIGAHQFSFKYHKGNVPCGLVVDHVCRNRSCVNPEHLQAISNAANVLSGEGLTAKHHRSTHCGRGHSLDNAYVRPDGLRMCRDCQQERSRQYKARKRSQRQIDEALK